MLKKIKFRSLLGNSWVLLFAAVLVAGGLTFLLYTYLTDREAKIKAEMAAQRNNAGIEVVVPNRDVPAGTPLSSGDFVAREIAPDLVYDDMIRAADFESYRPSRLVKAVRRGLPLRAADIDALRARDFSDVVPPGQRALTLEIDTVNSTSAMVRPGNRVDIYWVGKNLDPQANVNPTSTGDGKMIRLLMPDVLIMATGQDVRPRDAGEAMQNANNPQTDSNYNTVTVQVPVSEAARIVLAQKVGTLRLILRNSDDKDNKIPTQFLEGNLFSRSAKGFGVVEIISGGSDSAQTKLIAASPATSNATDVAHSAQSSGWSADPSTEAKRPSVYEEANAIAKQLQKIDTRGAPGRD
jgi:pilus assembly protein CpaB